MRRPCTLQIPYFLPRQGQCKVICVWSCPGITKVIFTVPFYYNTVQDDSKSTTMLFLPERRFLPPDFWQGNPLFLKQVSSYFLSLLQVIVSLCKWSENHEHPKVWKAPNFCLLVENKLAVRSLLRKKHPCLTHCPTVHTNLLAHCTGHKLGKGERETWRVGCIFQGL